MAAAEAAWGPRDYNSQGAPRGRVAETTGGLHGSRAAAMAAPGGETLFALELLVDAARLEAAAAPVPRPAVALRLLDFPALLVRPPPAAPPLQPGRPCAFGRGKRCLFRGRRGPLCAALRRRPLRALLLALPAAAAPPRLLGACRVPLGAAAALLRRPPAACAGRGRFPLRDARGRAVGELALRYRLRSLAAAPQTPSGPGPPRAASPGLAPGSEDEEEEDEEQEEEDEEEEEELEGNVFCPPVLYYHSGAAEPRPPAAAPSPQRPDPGAARPAPPGAASPEGRQKQRSGAGAAPRRQLRYGLTHTLRLRLQRSNPGALAAHERSERHRERHAEVPKEERSPPKKTPVRSAAEGPAACCGRRSREEGLRQNTRRGEAALGSRAGTASAELRREAACGARGKRGAAREEGPRAGETAQEAAACGAARKEQGAKARLRTPSPTQARAGGSGDGASAVSDHRSNPSPGGSAGSTSEFIYSEDCVASPENTVYSEGSSSAAYPGAGSETCHSSPGPRGLESPQPAYSHSESESSRSGVSEARRGADSTSAPQPVPSTSSPVHSRNCDVKTSRRTGGEAVDLLNDTSFQARLLHEEQVALISKEDNRADQHTKGTSTPRSKQDSSDTDLNVGKRQTLREKSQSLTQVSSYLPSNLSDLELSALENSMSDKDDDLLGTLGIPNQYKDISELVISKLPGYTM
ncbi:microtubule-associated protein 10 [Eudromia elegans]